MTSTLSLVAHQDDDLLFMNPDIASDVQAGQDTWIVYLTAGNLTPGPGGMGYADQRIRGERAAWATAAHRPNQWTFQRLNIGGRELAVNQLDGTALRLVFTFVNAANGPDNGDLYRMWHDPAFVAAPIDGRAPYTRDAFVGMLRGLIEHVQPTFLRCLDPWASEMGGHIDHVSAAHFALEANSSSGRVVRRADAYFDYIAAKMPINFAGYWRNEKLAAWNAYKPFDPQVGATAWDELAGRQFRRRIFWPGDAWVPTEGF